MDGPPPQEEDFSVIPISDRLAHKNWKARVSGYEALVKIFQTTASDTDPAFKPYINNPDLLKRIATDSNAVAQEKGVECLVALVKFAGESTTRSREHVVPALVDKCLGSTRVGTKNQAIELILQYVEVQNGGAGVVADIIPGLGAKQPKVVLGCVSALKEIIRNFGVQVTPPAAVLKTFPRIFSHGDKSVRAEGTLLAQALYQYLGHGIEPWLTELKPVQVKELKESFEAMETQGKGKGTLKPERMTREQAREAEARGGIDEDIADGEPEDALPDPLDCAEPVDIVPKLPSTLQAALLSSKWKERKEVLDDLLTALKSTPRIKEASELGEVARALSVRIQADANINCVMAAAQCMEGLAKGLRSGFARYREMVVPPMLERLKERKATVVDTIGAALDAVFMTTTLPDIIPDILPALASKNPQVKEGALKFLGRCLSTGATPVPPAQLKTLTTPLAALLEDGFEGARNEAATCLGTLMKMVGERPLNAVMDGLADVRKAKVREAYEKATVKCKAGAAAPPKPPPSKDTPAKKKVGANKASDPTLSLDDDEPLTLKKPPVKAPAKAAAKRPGSSTSAPPAPVAKKPAALPASASVTAKAGKGPAPGALDTFKYKHTPEDSEALAAELMPPHLLAGLADSNWKTRLATLDEVSTWLNDVITDLDAEVFVRAVGKKAWGEKNFQVSAKLYGLFALLAEQCPSFGRSCIALSVPHLIEKLGDAKLKKPAGDALLAYAETTSLQFVFNQSYDPLSKQKAPKVIADAVTWMDQALTEFGIAGVSLRALIEFLKTALKNSNAAVRSSATKALVTVKLFAGSGIKDFLEDLNPQLLNTIVGEFDKVDGNPAPEPSRTSADVASLTGPTALSNKGSAGDPLDELFPRVEIDGLLKGTTILADAKSEAWKTKKDALEALQAILDQGSNKRLKPTMGDIGQVLKARVTDTNKAVQTLALDIVSRIATGMGKPFEKQTKFFVLPVATVLADQKAPIRQAAIQTLTAIATACESIDSMVHPLKSALETTNPVQKSSLLQWLAFYFKEHEPSSTLDLSSWATSIVSSLDDRNADVRGGAQALLPVLITCAGFDYVMQQTNSLKPASRASAVPLIQSARAAAPITALPKPVMKPTPAGAPPTAEPTRAPSPIAAPASKLTGIRRKLPQGTASMPESRAATPLDPPSQTLTKQGLAGLKRPGASSHVIQASTSQSAVVSGSLPFSGNNIEQKRVRLGKDVQRWINESGPTRKDLAEALQHQMEPQTSKELLALLFSHDHNAVNDHIAGLTMMCDFFASAEAGGDDSYGLPPGELGAICLANFDLPLKYASIKAHEPQPNLGAKCLDIVEAVLTFLRSRNYQLSEAEAVCFVPTMIYKLGDAREVIRIRVQQIIQTLPKVYAYSRVFQMLLEYGLKSKVSKTRHGALEEIAGLLRRSGLGACEPPKAFPLIASMISDKDSLVRKAALTALSEGYSLVGDRIWTLVGPLPPKEKTQLEEKLRRAPGPSSPGPSKAESAQPAQIVRLTGGIPRPNSPASTTRIGGLPRPASPSVAGSSRLARPASPMHTARPPSPTTTTAGRANSPSLTSKPLGSTIAVPSSPTGIGRPRSMLPSRLGRPRSNFSQLSSNAVPIDEVVSGPPPNRLASVPPSVSEETQSNRVAEVDRPSDAPDDITVTISSILSSDPARSVDALKQIQKILATGPDAGPSSPQYQELAEHTEGLVETITLQMTHVFERPDDLTSPGNFRLAKHLIQTLNNFCDHGVLAESLTVDILSSLLEELTMRLLETDDSGVKEVKDLSRFINMIILRLFATGRRMSIFRALFSLLLQIVKPFPSNGTLPESKMAKVAELVLKCVWKLARNIPQDLKDMRLDPVELFPAIEHFLQSVPPNEWRARATNKVPCGDMPLRTIKVIIQHVVAHYGDDVYDLLSASFDDPSATIVYPYVYRILNSTAKPPAEALPTRRNGVVQEPPVARPFSEMSSLSSRPLSPHGTSSSAASHPPSSPGRRASPASLNGHEPYQYSSEEPDPDAQLLTIIGHISSETTGALHKEGITELHHFLKAYPHKRPRVEKLLESTGAAFRKYINRALASRAAEDQERDVAVADTLSKLESNKRPTTPTSPPCQPEQLSRQTALSETAGAEDRMSRLQQLLQSRSSSVSNGSSYGHARTSSAIPPASRFSQAG